MKTIIKQIAFLLLITLSFSCSNDDDDKTRVLTDKEILQAILDANPNNTLGWDLETTTDLGTLVGVTTNNEGQIIELVIASRNLISIPPEIGQLTNLMELYPYQNNLTSLPPEIGQLTNLTNLELYDNQLSVLPPEIGQLINLEELILRINNLNTVPSEMGTLAGLTSVKNC